jgi:hypothetical protein
MMMHAHNRNHHHRGRHNDLRVASMSPMPAPACFVNKATSGSKKSEYTG